MYTILRKLGTINIFSPAWVVVMGNSIQNNVNGPTIVYNEP